MSHNTIIHRIVRPIVRHAAGTGVTPNQVSIVRLATGLAAALCFAGGSGAWMLAGTLLFLLSMLLDRADGELARFTNQTSAAGHRLDLLSDCIASIAAFVGLGVGLASQHGPDAVWLGSVAGLGIGALFAELNILNLVSVRGYDLADGISVDPDDAVVLVPVLIWLGLAWPMTIAAAIITPLAAVIVAGIGLRRRYAL